MVNPAADGELRIFNQVVETFSVNDLAEKVVRVGQARGHKVEVESIENPRVEKEEHYYNPTYTGLKELGLKPHPLTDEVLGGIFETVEQFRDNVAEHKIFRGYKW